MGGTRLENGFDCFNFPHYLVRQPVETRVQNSVTLRRFEGKVPRIQPWILAFDEFIKARYGAFDGNQDILLKDFTRIFE